MDRGLCYIFQDHMKAVVNGVMIATTSTTMSLTGCGICMGEKGSSMPEFDKEQMEMILFLTLSIGINTFI